ncbi:MarR family winged helix-turn-helix transcriptional regulator [Brevibacterium oceani]|uniref:MarR family winged helix-turn-helix transcriptional regulator n=1 Tax=Brevibacterium oceani TaxID=358099 RepID=UPI001B344185|nr:MarR family winged helix-turn-helix transcriptional regulator [Brevibacterium oceani]
MDNQRTQTIRTISARLNSFHSSMYFSQTVGAVYAEHGLEPGVEGNMAARSAPLGRVNPGVVSAAYYNYSPNFVADMLPKLWDTVTPEEMVQARFDAVAAFMDELFGDRDDIALLTEAATQVDEAVQPVLANMDFAGRTLAAATADALGGHRGETVFEKLWDSATIAREFRGDGHVASLVTAGVPGIDALMLDVATGAGFRPRAAQKTRGYTDEEWQTAQARLAEAGLITVDTDDRDYDLPVITDAGRELREQVEQLTDGTVAAAWSVLDDDELEALLSPSRTLIKVIAQSGAFPATVFAQPAKKAG